MLASMVIVYVRHYLTTAGIAFFHSHWFPKVHSILERQKGFISLQHTHKKDQADCLNLTLQFQDQETLNAWCAHPDHDTLVEALDPYRSRNYWEAALAEENQADATDLAWETIKPRNQTLGT